MDDSDINKQYSYKALSNLVLPQERRRRARASETGEVASLQIGQLGGRMGDRAGSRTDAAKDPELEKRLAKRRERADGNAVASASRNPPLERGAMDIVDTADKLQLDAGGVGYIPTTPVSQKAYEGLLAFMVSKMGDQPNEYLRSAAEETIAILKDQNVRELEKKDLISELLAQSMSEEEFARLSTFGRTIEDFGTENENAPEANRDDAMNDEVDEDQGVGVIIEGDEDSDLPDEIEDPVDQDDEVLDNAAPILRDDDDEDAEGDEDGLRASETAVPGRNASTASGLSFKFSSSISATQTEGSGSGRSKNKSSSNHLDPLEVDGYWIQRKLSGYYSDPHECQEMAEKVLVALSEDTDNAACENNLVLLFDFEKVDFIKMVLKHRAIVVFCTRLARAQGPEERAKIEEEMQQTEEGKDLLTNLNAEGHVPAENEEGQNKPRKRRRHVPLSINGEGEAHSDSAGGTRVSSRRQKMALRKLDLEDMVFSQGNHLLSSKNFSDPPGSQRIEYKDYEEWHIPAPVVAPKSDERDSFPISSMPTWAQSAFGNTTHLNRLQTAVFPCAFESDRNLLICAPTGAGKTNVAVLTILRAFYNSASTAVHVEDFAISQANLSAFKVVYVAPMKALVAEVVTKLGNCLTEFGISVRELTGDINLTKREVDETQVIVTTPEKWDVITRKSGERTFTSLVRLLIIDEIHLLHDDRGPVLEAIIARTMRNVENTAAETRLVGLSATLPNYKDVATLLQVDKEDGLFYFDGSYRPSPLQQCYVGITARKAVTRFKIMNDITYEKAKTQVVSANQVIVFVHSRKETTSTARHIIDNAIEDKSIGYFMQHDSDSYNIIQAELDGVDSESLRNLLLRGVAIHHAGMTRKDRLLVEGLFEGGHIKVLVSTSTLAWGVNLPAHAVIIKGTQVYSPEKGRWIELSPMDVMQMMGRAGRPQFDKYGEGFIITTRLEIQFYLSLLNQQLPIESQLISRIVDLVNAEIATGCVTSIEDGAKWLTYTYLFIRMSKNPTLYNVSVDERQADPMLERRRMELIHSAAIVLHRAKLIIYNRKTGTLASTELGRIASDFYVGHRTMAIYVENVHPLMGDIDLLRLFSLSGEFKHMRVREEEKLEVVRLSEVVPIPVKDSLEEASAKVNVLMQAYISNIRLDGLVLKADMVYITQNAARLCRALLRIIIQKRWAALADRCLRLCKMVDKKQWASQTPLRQFSEIVDESILRKVERKYIDFERYYGLSSAELGELLRDPKLGRTAHKLVHSLPKMEMDVHVRPLTRSTLEIELYLTPDFMFKSNIHGSGETFWIFVEDADSEHLLYAESLYLRRAVAKVTHTMIFTVQVTKPRPPHYFVKCCSDRWITPDSVVPVSFQHLILPESFSPHSEFLALRPLSIQNALVLDVEEAFDKEACEESQAVLRSYYQGQEGKHFSSFVTQLIPSLFKSNGNAVLATLPGVDRTTCAELAVGRLFCLQPASVVVWVTGGGEEAVNVVARRMQKGIGNALGLTVSTLQGEHATDVAAIRQRGSVVVTSPQHFDAFSRKWQGKRESRALKGVGLVILDGAHLLGEKSGAGSIMEVVGSRMRYLSQQLCNEGEQPCRLVAISDPIANASDVGDWLDVPRERLHTFLPSSLPGCPRVEVIPCVSRAGGGVLSSPAALSRRIYNSMRQFSDGEVEPIVVFVPTRKLTRAMALELVTMGPGKGGQKGFLRESETVVGPYLQKVRLSSLRECLSYGVAYLHEGLSDSDKQITEVLFRTGVAQILVTTSKYACQSLDVKGRLVIVAGTATEEAGGFSVRRAEYPKSDLTNMISCAKPSSRGAPGTCVIMTEPPLEEFYRRISLRPTPLESQLSDVLADQINAEVASRVIETKENVVHYLTWTFFYRRLPKNPNYYGMRGTSHIEISSHLSDMVEQALADLRDAKCVDAKGDEDMALSALNLGIIAAHYYIRHATVERFASLVTPKMKHRGLLNIVSNASEFDDVPARIGDEEAMERLSMSAPVRLKKVGDVVPSLSSLEVKVHLLLQSHLSRVALAGDLLEDRAAVVGRSVRLLRSMVDIISSAGWLEPALACMELSQMIVQAVWDTDKPLLQLPHFEEDLVKTLQDTYNVNDVSEFLNMDKKSRDEAISGLSQAQIREVAQACQVTPEITWEFEEPVYMDDDIMLIVSLERLTDETDTVSAPRFPEPKSEGWWIVIGDTSMNSLVTLKHISVKQKSTVKLKFSAPDDAGEHNLTAYLVSDSYIDCDLEESITVTVPERNDVDMSDHDEIVPVGEDVAS